MENNRDYSSAFSVPADLDPSAFPPTGTSPLRFIVAGSVILTIIFVALVAGLWCWPRCTRGIFGNPAADMDVENAIPRRRAGRCRLLEFFSTGNGNRAPPIPLAMIIPERRATSPPPPYSPTPEGSAEGGSQEYLHPNSSGGMARDGSVSPTLSWESARVHDRGYRQSSPGLTVDGATIYNSRDPPAYYDGE